VRSALAVVHERPELDAHPRPRERGLRDGVLPRPLAAPAHRQEVAPAQLEGARRASGGGAQQESPGLAERQDRDHGVVGEAAQPVTVPRDAVAAVPVVRKGDAGEGEAVVAGQGLGCLHEHGVAGPVLGQFRDQARDVDDTLVHPTPMMFPAGRPAQSLEHRVVPLEPAGQVIHPGPRAECQAPETGETGVQARLP
jgi:hypothetical protein